MSEVEPAPNREGIILTAFKFELQNIDKRYRVLFCALIAVLIQGCVFSAPLIGATSNSDSKTYTPDDLQSAYSKLAKTDGRVFAFNPKLSSIRVYAFRGGAAPALGHNHVLSLPNFIGFVFLPNKRISDARFDLEFRLDQLELDNPEDRSKLGEAFATHPTPDDIKRTRDHMLGNDNLQANLFPLVRIHAVHIAGERPKLAVDALVEMHGQQQTISLPINVEVLPDHVSVTSAFVIRQSDFGIKAYSVLGGFLAVQNELVIEFSLVGTNTPL